MCLHNPISRGISRECDHSPNKKLGLVANRMTRYWAPLRLLLHYAVWSSEPPCKAERQQLLTWKVSSCCLSALHDRADAAEIWPTKQTNRNVREILMSRCLQEKWLWNCCLAVWSRWFLPVCYTDSYTTHCVEVWSPWLSDQLWTSRADNTDCVHQQKKDSKSTRWSRSCEV